MPSRVDDRSNLPASLVAVLVARFCLREAAPGGVSLAGLNYRRLPFFFVRLVYRLTSAGNGANGKAPISVVVTPSRVLPVTIVRCGGKL